MHVKDTEAVVMVKIQQFNSIELPAIIL